MIQGDAKAAGHVGVSYTCAQNRPLGVRSVGIAERLARGASAYIVWLAIGKGLTVIVQVVLGRWLGPSDYGMYSLGYSTTSLLSWVSVLGLDQGVLRFCAVHQTREHFDSAGATFWRALKLAIVASVLTSALLVLGSGTIAGWFFTPSFAVVLFGFAITLPFVALIRVAGTYLQSLHDIHRMSVLQLLARPSLNLALLVLAIGFGWGLGGAVGAYVLCCVGAAGIAAYYLLKKSPTRPVLGRRTPRADPSLMRYSLALMCSGLGYQVILRAPQVALGHFSTKVQVGIFSAGASFALGFCFMNSTFLQPAMPIIVELHEKKQYEALQHLYQNATRWTLAVVTPIFLILCLFTNQIMSFFGRDFAAGGPVLLAMSLAWLVYYCKGPGSALLQMTGRQNLDLANTVGVAALTVASNCLAIPLYGAFGAAFATAASIVVWSLLEYFEIKVIYGLSPWSRGAQRNILGTAVIAAITIFLRHLLSWEILLLTTLCAYGIFYFNFCLEAEDRRAFAGVLGNLGISPRS